MHDHIFNILSMCNTSLNVALDLLAKQMLRSGDHVLDLHGMSLSTATKAVKTPVFAGF